MRLLAPQCPEELLSEGLRKHNQEGPQQSQLPPLLFSKPARTNVSNDQQQQGVYNITPLAEVTEVTGSCPEKEKKKKKWLWNGEAWYGFVPDNGKCYNDDNLNSSLICHLASGHGL